MNTKEGKSFNWQNLLGAGIGYVIFKSIPGLSSISLIFICFAGACFLIHTLLKKFSSISEDIRGLISVLLGFISYCIFVIFYYKPDLENFLPKLLIISFFTFFLILRKKWAWICLTLYLLIEGIYTPIYLYYSKSHWASIVSNIAFTSALLFFLIRKNSREAYLNQSVQSQTQEQINKKNGMAKIFVTIAVISLLSIIALIILGLQNDEPKEYSSAELAKQYNSSVVLVGTYDKNGTFNSLGSGIVITSDGLILTNYHVISHSNGGVIKTKDGAYYFFEKPLEIDPHFDLALLNIDAKNLSPIALGNSSNVVVGQKVICIGNPEGLNNSLSEGIISSIRGDEYFTLFQTTAPISHGSSGGAMFDSFGKLIGVTTSILPDAQNINFAVPSQYAQWMLYRHIKIDPELETDAIKSYLSKEEIVINGLKKEYDSQLENIKKEVIERNITTKAALTKYITENSNLESIQDLEESLENRTAAYEELTSKIKSVIPEKKNN